MVLWILAFLVLKEEGGRARCGVVSEEAGAGAQAGWYFGFETRGLFP
jgi:hypothetical protein